MITAVPTNIITGFLGVGKTTAILNLLKNKPESENWAVLVNEFGEIGIDGALMSEHGAMIKQVPGGCMCCTAGVPMSVGINALLRQKPDRLIIEPTGLGHPKQVVAVLTSEQYQTSVDLKATLALVDPRNLSDEKYTSNSNFNDQLDSADVIIANKADQCSKSDLQQFEQWIETSNAQGKVHEVVSHGEIPLHLLDKERLQGVESTKIHAHHHDHADLEPQFMLEPGQSFVRKENKGQGHFSCGWLFGAEHIFDFDLMFSMLSALTAERVKAVVNTTNGCYSFNLANGVLSVNEMSLDGFETRMEVIDSQQLNWDQLEAALLHIGGITEPTS